MDPFDQSTALCDLCPPDVAGYYIEFADGLPGAGYQYRLEAFTDEAIEDARLRAEASRGEPFPVSTRTGYPEFTVFLDGDEVGGG